MSLFKQMSDRIARRRNPVEYWRGRGAVIGENCEIYASASFGSEPYLIEIGNHVRINAGVEMVTHDGGVWVLRGMKPELKDLDLFGRIKIGNNVHIGTNAMIMPGVTIGNDCIIGCGAIVTHDVLDGTVVAGIPARTVESVDEYYIKHSFDFDFTKHMSPAEKREYLEKKYDL